jgi:D-3-phosphoglycerate dehydrogenase
MVFMLMEHYGRSVVAVSDSVSPSLDPARDVNTARVPIVDEVALAHTLDAGQLRGAALDVLPQELPMSSPLFGRDNVILTPHASVYSVEPLVELQIKAADEVLRALTGQTLQLPVNPEALKSGVEAAPIDRQ